jgi:hypothetical protein
VEDPRAHGCPRARWRLADLHAVLPALAGYSPSGLSRLLRRLGCARQRGRLHLQSPDPAYARKAARLRRALALARAQPERLTLCFGDEMSLHRQPTLADRWHPVGTEPTAPLSCRSNTRHRLCGALDAVTGRVTATSGAKTTLAHLRRFLRRLRAAHPVGHLWLVWDNWPVHAHPAVRAEAAKLGILLLWLPTYAPWLNPIEKLWRALRQEVLHHHRLADDWDGLKAAVAAFLARFEQSSPDLLRAVGLCPDQ